MHNSRLTRKSHLKRRTGLKRSTTRIRSRSPAKALRDRDYNNLKREYLRRHPFCQIFLAENGLDEAAIFKEGVETLMIAGGYGSIEVAGIEIPLAYEIHHRNKRNGPRCNDQRWWMAASRAEHDRVENHKDWARGRGYLLNISANPDGREPGGRQALTTDELLAQRAAEKAGEPPVTS